jgi:hypothetical protein
MLALDHIVIAGKNAEEDSISYNKRMAIKAIKGGEHDNWGTYNYLAYFSNESYIEWLGIQDDEKARNSTNPLIKHLVYMLDHNKTGPFQIALRTDQMDDYISHFKENNIPFEGPFPGKRQRPDGSMLSWRMLFPKYDLDGAMLPFLIEWSSPEGGPSINSLANPQAITKISYGGIDKAAFMHIYHLKNKRSLTNQFSLQNTKITFNKEGRLSFDLI